MKHIIKLTILVLMISSCTGNEGEKPVQSNFTADRREMSAMAKISPATVPPANDIPEKPEVDKQKIIRDGRMTIRVNELEKKKNITDTLVKKHEGYYANESYNNTEKETSYNLKIRIPSENFEKFISDIESGEGEILYKEIDARDVTDQFIDLETRLENKKSYLTRYKELLKQANGVKEILDIQERIRQLEEEIESTTGRLNYLNDLVDYSTLNLHLTREKDFKYSPEKRDNFTELLKQSLSKGWHGFIDFLLFLIKLWPLWIIVILLVFILFRTRRKKRNNK